MALFILKGLVTNDGIDCLKMASIVYENGIDRLQKGNQHRRHYIHRYPFIHLVEERHCESQKCLAQEHITMSGQGPFPDSRAILSTAL